jgi:hypothetical protein
VCGAALSRAVSDPWTIDDPSKATVDVAGLGDGTVWTNSRDVDLRVEASDPQSGIASIKADVRSADGERQLGLGQWGPDTLHATPRVFATPPLGVGRAAARRITAASSGRTSVTVRVTNGAGSTTTTRGAIRVDREKPTISWPEKVKPGARVVLRDGGAGLSEGSGLRIVGTDAEVRCVAAEPTCAVRVPASVRRGASVEVTAVDGAGNSRVAKRRVAAGSAGAPVPPPSATPRGDTTTIRNARVVGPGGEPFNGYALIQWADPGLTGGGVAQDATPPLFEGRVEGGLVPEFDVPTEVLAYGRALKNQSLNIVATLDADAGWTTLQFDVWDLATTVASARSGSRPLPQARPFKLSIDKKNATLRGYAGTRRATPRQAPPSPDNTTCGKSGAKGDRIWLAYAKSGKLETETMRIFEAHAWHDESFTFDLSMVKSVTVGVAISGSWNGAGVSATSNFEKSRTIEDEIGSKSRSRKGPFRTWVSMDVDVRRYDLYLVDKSEFQRYRTSEMTEGSPEQPGPKRRAEMLCPGNSRMQGHSVVQSGGGISWEGTPAAGRDGRVVDKAGGDSAYWDRAPADQKEMAVGRKAAYKVDRGFSVGGGAGSVSTFQARAEESASIARWKFTESAKDAKDHFFGGTEKGTAQTWPVIYAGQKKK